jgi:lipoyl-dependent peroxiredoxin subunit D
VPLQLEKGRSDLGGGVTLPDLEAVRGALPESARDIKLNLQAVLQGGAGPLTDPQRWGVALASAYASRNPDVTQAVLAEARASVTADVIDDARAAAALMGMNNVYYRFRHMVGKSRYSEMPARLRMNRLAKPATNQVDFELFSLAVSAINGCETCVRAHEKVVTDGGLTEEHVHDAVRIAATVAAAAIALETAEAPVTAVMEGPSPDLRR